VSSLRNGFPSCRPAGEGEIRVPALILVSACLVLCSCRPAPRDGLVLITIDTLRADALGAFGRDDARTPVLDRLAEQGIRADAYTPIPLTLPSHASIMTGLHPASHGIRRNGAVLRAGVRTLAGTLRELGYATGAVVSGLTLDPRFGLHRDFDVVDAEGIRKDGRLARGATGAALGVVDQLFEKWPGQSAFLWVHYFDPHSAYAPPPPFDELWDSSASPWDGSHQTHNRVIYGGLPATEELLARNRNLYQGEVAYVDREIGELLEGLADRGLENPLLVVTSDHGESFRAEYPFDHADRLFGEILRVPLIVHGPGLPSGLRFPGEVRLQDLAPTILELRGHEVEPGLDGVSRAAELLGAAEPRALPVLSESPRARPRPEAKRSGLNRGALRAVQQDGCKLVWNLDREESVLYDLHQSPDGLDLVPDPGRCDEASLRQLFEAWMRAHPDALRQSGGSKPAEIPPDLRRELEALGYALE
jgi:arylsulfatase A-like enzyme